MPVEIELDIFSGRPNPKWSLEPREEAEFFERMSSLAPESGSSFVEPPGLGYRGLSLSISKAGEKQEARVYQGSVQIDGKQKKDATSALERWLLETAHSVEPQLLDTIKKSLP